MTSISNPPRNLVINGNLCIEPQVHPVYCNPAEATIDVDSDDGYLTDELLDGYLPDIDEDDEINTKDTSELVKTEENIEQCSICFDEHNLIKNSLCDCKYFFHKKCFITWIGMSKRSTCIMCNTLIDLDNIIKTESSEILSRTSSDSSNEQSDGIGVQNINSENDSLPHDYFLELRAAIGSVILDPNFNIELLSPVELYQNLSMGFTIPNSPFSYYWEDRNSEISRNITLNIVPGRGVYFHSIDSNGETRTNLQNFRRSRRNRRNELIIQDDLSRSLEDLVFSDSTNALDLRNSTYPASSAHLIRRFNTHISEEENGFRTRLKRVCKSKVTRGVFFGVSLVSIFVGVFNYAAEMN